MKIYVKWGGTAFLCSLICITLFMVTQAQTNQVSPSFYVKAEPSTVVTGGTSIVTFVTHSTAVSARLYLTCPIGVKVTLIGGDPGDLCNQWITFNKPLTKKVIFAVTNTVPAAQNISVDFYEYMPDNPTFARTTSTRLIVQAKDSVATDAPPSTEAHTVLDSPQMTSPDEGSPPLSVSACYVFKSSLKIGDKGERVIALQTWLMSKGFKIPDIASGLKKKGTYGDQTAKAVKEYQLSVNIKGTGTFGPLTLAKVNAGCGLDSSSSLAIPESSSTLSTKTPTPLIATPAPSVKSVTWKFVGQDVSYNPGTASEASSIVGTIVLEASPKGDFMKKPTVADFSVLFALRTSDNGKYDASNSISVDSEFTHKGIIVTPVVAIMGEGGAYRISIIGSMQTNDPRFLCSQSGKEIFMAIKNIDVVIGDMVIVDQPVDANEFRTLPVRLIKNIGCTVTPSPSPVAPPVSATPQPVVSTPPVIAPTPSSTYIPYSEPAVLPEWSSPAPSPSPSGSPQP